MTQEERFALIRTLLKRVAPESDPAILKPDDPIQSSLGMDSYDFLQFIIAMCEATGVTIPEEDYGKIGTMRELEGYLGEKGH